MTRWKTLRPRAARSAIDIYHDLIVGTDPPRVRVSSDNPRYSPYEGALDQAGFEGRVLGKWQWV